MARKNTSNSDDTATSTFEDALTGLEAIVESMEQDQLPLEQLVAQYEKGTALLERCESILKSAHDRIELITLRNRTPASTEATGSLSGISPPSATPDDSDDDDIRLF